MAGDNAHFCLCKALFGVPMDKLYAPLAAATIAQFVFGFLWFSLICNNAYIRSLAVDKGVKAAAHIKQRYSTIMSMAQSLISSFFRAAAIVSVMHHVTVQAKFSSSLCIYSQAGVAVWVVQMLPYLEEAFYAQRPMSLISVTAAYNLGCALLASMCLFFVKM